MRALEAVAVFAQQKEPGDIPWNQGRLIAVLTAVLVLTVMVVGIGVVSKARKQSTSDAIEIGARVIIGAAIAASGAGILAMGALILSWSGLVS